MEKSKEMLSMLNGEQKIKPGERVDVARIALHNNEWEKIKQDYEKTLVTMNTSFPHLDFRLDKAYGVVREDGRLHIRCCSRPVSTLLDVVPAKITKAVRNGTNPWRVTWLMHILRLPISLT